MKRRTRAALLVGSTLLSLIAIGATPAVAAGTWTASAGSAPPGTVVSITALTVGDGPQVRVADVTSGLELYCDSAGAMASGATGTGLDGNQIFSFNGASATWTNCIGPLGLELDPTGVGTWYLNADSYDSTTGVTRGTISNIRATVADPNGNCSFDIAGPKVDGTITAGSEFGTYTNATQNKQLLASGSQLYIWNIVGCFGLINEGDQLTVEATYHLTADDPANNPLTLTSP